MSQTVFINIGEALTLQEASEKGGRCVKEADLSIIKDAALVAKDGRIQWIGPRKDLPADCKGVEVNLQNRPIMPAFVECHTHLAFAGDRAEEFEWRMKGMTYQEIAKNGGGILSTVKATRNSSDEELSALMQKRANEFLKQGVTTLEVKSGYGLDLETELRSLRCAKKLQFPNLVLTYLGLHAKPPEFVSLDEYATFVVDQVLPRVAAEKLADRVDAFIEQGFFTPEQASQYFSRARDLGLAVIGHVEQLSHSGGTSTALSHFAQSVDHIVEVNDSEIKSLAASNTVAVLLPTSDFYLRMKYPPARRILDEGACVALSTDFNPGTSPTQDISFVGVLARLEMKMTLPEVISAWTVGPSRALGKDQLVGSLEIGKACDFIVLDDSFSQLFYRVGSLPIQSVWSGAKKLYEKSFDF